MSLIISHKGENDSIALDMVMVRMMVYFSCLSALWCQYSRVYSVKYTLWGWFFLVQILILSDSCPDFGSFYFWPDFDPFIFLSRFWSFLYFCPDFDPFFIFLSRFWSFFIFWSRFWSFLYFCPDFDPLKKMLSRFWFFLHLTIYLPLTQFFWRLKYMPVYACQLHVSRGMFKGALAHWFRT